MLRAVRCVKVSIDEDQKSSLDLTMPEIRQIAVDTYTGKFSLFGDQARFLCVNRL